MYKTASKKIVALVMTLVVIFSCSSVALAQEKKAFKIRWSSDYSFSGVYVMITTKNSSGTLGTITLASGIDIKLPEKGGKVHLNAGTTWDYKITSMKDGSTITLVTDYNKDDGKTDTDSYAALRDNGMAKMTAKIHINGSKKFYNIWKIDTFTRFHTPEGIAPEAWGRGIPYESGLARPGFYFRDT